MTEAAALRAVTFRWRGARQPVLRDVDLVLNAGATTAITGANGAGKTTLLRLLAGVLRPASGDVRVPERLSWMPAASAGLYARLDVAGHLDLQARLTLVPRQARAGTIASAVDRFALAPLLARRADRLSTGQRQRVRLALAFLGDPALVLLDEPQASLDDGGAELLQRAVTDATVAGACVAWAAPSTVGLPVGASHVVVRGSTVVPA